MSEETHEEFIAAEKRLSVALASHEGRWVSVRDHAVVVSADTLEELLSALVQMGIAYDYGHSVFQVAPAGMAFL